MLHNELLDLHMPVQNGGRGPTTRAVDGYRALSDAAGFRLTRVIATNSPLSVTGTSTRPGAHGWRAVPPAFPGASGIAPAGLVIPAP
jgi:hypothetical protein